MFNFEKLEVWQRGVELANAIYRVTRTYPADERFGLTSQTRRAAVSIAANIAEGRGRGTDRDFARFLEIAYGSLMEVVSHLAIAKSQSLINEENYSDLYQKAEQLARMLSGLRKSLKL